MYIVRVLAEHGIRLCSETCRRDLLVGLTQALNLNNKSDTFKFLYYASTETVSCSAQLNELGTIVGAIFDLSF